MLIVAVHIRVKPECVEAFKAATLDNASNSVREPGIARFDFFQQAENPCRFLLVEVYRYEQATTAHKESPHYLKWREAVVDMMAEPRKGERYANVFPDDAGWG